MGLPDVAFPGDAMNGKRLPNRACMMTPAVGWQNPDRQNDVEYFCWQNLECLRRLVCNKCKRTMRVVFKPGNEPIIHDWFFNGGSDFRAEEARRRPHQRSGRSMALRTRRGRFPKVQRAGTEGDAQPVVVQPDEWDSTDKIIGRIESAGRSKSIQSGLGLIQVGTRDVADEANSA